MFALLAAAAVGAFVFYKVYLPALIADAVVKDEGSAYLPKFVEVRIRKYKAPVNEAAGDVVEQIHQSDITMDQILKAIDDTDESQVDAAIAELSTREINSTNEVFDIAKKHFPVGFDVELLRKPFNENVDLDMVRAAVEKARQKKEDEMVDPEMAKAVLKQILIQKEEEYQKHVKGN